MPRDEVGACDSTPDTTLPAEDSLDKVEVERRRLALLWVFPRLRCHMLDVGQGPWRIGRSPDCEIAINDRLASREHARIVRKGPLVVLEDLHSRNGTFVQGASIQQVPITAGTVIRIGDWVGILVEKVMDQGAGLALEELLPGYFVGPTLSHILEPLEHAARSPLPILIHGATGTGKEKVAEYVHRQSRRAGPFHPVNCATIPADLAESQLFGHQPGAFTSARCGHIGHFRAADGGTLFLDEVTELPRAVQAKLLRAVQDQKVTALGETKSVPIDVRIVASCQRPLEAYVGEEEFRLDLLARLSGLVVSLPTLAARIEEVPTLFLRLLERHATAAVPHIDGKLIERLCLYDWPCNVRELELLARQLLAVHGHEARFRQAHLPAAIRRASVPRDDGTAAGSRRDQVERLVRALRSADGNITRASATLGISRAAAYRMMAGRSIADLMARYPLRERN